MSEKIHMTFEQACRLAFRSVEIGNTENALAIMAGIGGRIEEIVAERDRFRGEVERLTAENAVAWDTIEALGDDVTRAFERVKAALRAKKGSDHE